MKENHSKLLEHSKKYAAEFQKREWNKFNIGDKVLMKNELKLNKMDDEYKEEGIVIEIRYHVLMCQKQISAMNLYDCYASSS